MKSLIEKIKGPRTLTFNHWRYKLLHWTFGVNPKNASDSRLPHPLYTHYCPLFWLTNLFVLTAIPLALCRNVVWPILKFSLWLTTPVISVFRIIVNSVLGLLTKMSQVKVKLPNFLTEEQKLKKKKRSEKEVVYREVWGLFESDNQVENKIAWEHYWTMNNHRFILLSKDEVREVFDQCFEQFHLNLESKKRSAENFANLIAFARMATLVAFYAICAGSLIGASFLLYFGIPWLINQVVVFFNWASTWPWVEIGMTTALILGSVISVVFSVAFANWIRLGQRMGETTHSISQFIGPKVATIASFLIWPFVMCARIVYAFGEFVVELYANNCPAITIVDDRSDVVFDAYINSVMDYLNGDPDADHDLMASVERHIGEEGVPHSKTDEYRKTLAAFIGNLSTKNVKFTIHSHPDLFQAIQRKIATDDDSETLKGIQKPVYFEGLS